MPVWLLSNVGGPSIHLFGHYLSILCGHLFEIKHKLFIKLEMKSPSPYNRPRNFWICGGEVSLPPKNEISRAAMWPGSGTCRPIGWPFQGRVLSGCIFHGFCIFVFSQGMKFRAFSWPMFSQGILFTGFTNLLLRVKVFLTYTLSHASSL